MQASLRSSWLRWICCVIAWMASLTFPSRGDELPIIRDVEFQPLAAQVKRVVEALTMLGEPLSPEEAARLERSLDTTGPESAIRTIQEVLDRHCLIGIEI